MQIAFLHETYIKSSSWLIEISVKLHRNERYRRIVQPASQYNRKQVESILSSHYNYRPITDFGRVFLVPCKTRLVRCTLLYSSLH